MSVPVEKVETINRRLHEHYGETEYRGERLPNFRVVFSEDQLAKQLSYFTKDGFQLLTPIVRELPKYKQWIHEKYILERLTCVPTINAREMLEEEMSYEPIWVFEDPTNGLALPPAWLAAKFVVDGLHRAMEEAGIYTRHPDSNESVEQRIEKLKELESVLFADASDVGDALATKNAISMAGLDGRSEKK